MNKGGGEKARAEKAAREGGGRGGRGRGRGGATVKKGAPRVPSAPAPGGRLRVLNTHIGVEGEPPRLPPKRAKPVDAGEGFDGGGSKDGGSSLVGWRGFTGGGYGVDGLGIVPGAANAGGNFSRSAQEPAEQTRTRPSRAQPSPRPRRFRLQSPVQLRALPRAEAHGR